MEESTVGLLRIVAREARNVAAHVAEQAGISRQAASARLRKLVDARLVERFGTGAGVRYAIKSQTQVHQVFQCQGLSEDRVWQQLGQPVVAGLAENVCDIWRYGLTEMINNAIDHSGSIQVHVGLRRNALFTQAWVMDDGEGIFLRIQRALGLFEPREAILELAKGKFTTDPANHSGEGIFFASKLFDIFDIQSGPLHFAQHAGRVEIFFDGERARPGSTVFIQLDNDSLRTTREVFDRFAAPEEYEFAKTLVPVKLAQAEGEKLVSRSQAKRLSQRFERFQTVVLDFEGVGEIGQAFADEIFRVFQVAHPRTTLETTNMAPRVKQMVTRALATG